MSSFRRVAPALVAVLTLPVAALAETPVVVLPYAPLYGGLPQSAGDKTAALVAEELSASGEYSVTVAGAKSASTTVKGEAELAAAKKEIAAAEKELSSAVNLYKGRKMRPAANAFEKGITRYLANIHGAESISALSDAYVGLALARVRLGEEEKALALLGELVRLDPERVLEGQQFPSGQAIPPLLVSLHEKVRGEVFAQARGEIRISSTPAGAKVLLDGRELGETPLLARQVLPGVHYVRVQKEGAGTAWQKLTVEAGKSASFSSTLAAEASGPASDIARSLGQNSLTPETTAAVRTLGRAQKAAWVVFGVLRPEGANIGVKSWALRVEDGAITALSSLTFDVEMLGAAIEVFKLASDFAGKTNAFEGVALTTELIPYPDARAPVAAGETFTEVAVTRLSLDASKASAEDSGRRGGRGPVRSNASQPKAPVAPPAAEEKKAEPAAEEPAPRRLRERGKIGEAPPPVEKKAEPKIELALEAPKSSALVLEAEEKDEESAVDLSPKSGKGRTLAALDPEELARMQALEENDSKDSGLGKTLLWTGVGVVGAGAVATGLYFLLSPSTPTSATAHVSW